MYGVTALHPSAPSGVGDHKFRVCPVWFSNPDAHPEVSTALRYFSRWRRFGFDVLPESEKLLQVIEILDSEFGRLEKHKWEREHPAK